MRFMIVAGRSLARKATMMAASSWRSRPAMAGMAPAPLPSGPWQPMQPCAASGAGDAAGAAPCAAATAGRSAPRTKVAAPGKVLLDDMGYLRSAFAFRSGACRGLCGEDAGSALILRRFGARTAQAE